MKGKWRKVGEAAIISLFSFQEGDFWDDSLFLVNFNRMDGV